jgi:putative nucleotidyltransferase with HDIG domain
VEEKSNNLDSTVYNPHIVFGDKPWLIIRAAALIAENDFVARGDVLEASKVYASSLERCNGKLVWKELKRLLRSDTPSKGIEFLRFVGALDFVLPELEDCIGVEQNNKYHKYDVYEHCLKACDTCKSENVLVRFAALIHDVGKPSTKGENETGITFHRHEVISTRLTRNIVSRLELKPSEAEEVLLLVSNHMYQYDRAWKTSTVKRFISRVGLTKEYVGKLDTFPLFQLRHADRTGRGLDPKTSKQHDFEARLEEVLLSENKEVETI